MWHDEQKNPWDQEPGSHRKIYLLNGKLLNYAIKVWVGLMIGISVMETFHPAEGLGDLDMLKIKFIVFSMVGVIFLGTLPWLIDPKATWRFAKSEPGNFQGICNRCAALLPLVGLVGLFVSGIYWVLYF
jgi:hypothetical protein